jgi:hypothetical protein
MTITAARRPIEDERSQLDFPDQWRAGLTRLEPCGPDVYCTVSEMRNSGEPIPEHLADTPYVCGHEGTWLRRPSAECPDGEYLCDAHGSAFTRWTVRRRKARQDRNQMRAWEITFVLDRRGCGCD